VAELLAIGQQEGHRWRQTLPAGERIRLGRSPRDGWMVPWDSRISRDHCDIQWKNGVLLVRTLETASNPTFFRDRPSREFYVRPGEEFRIARTRFEVRESVASAPPSEDSTQMSAARSLLDTEIAAAAWGITANLDIGDASEFDLLKSAIRSQLNANIDQAFFLLTCFLSSKKNNFGGVRFSTARREQKELMITRILKDLPKEARRHAMPLLFADESKAALKRLEAESPDLVPPSLSRERRLSEILAGQPSGQVTPWIQATALYSAAKSPSDEFEASIVVALQSKSGVVRETAVCALAAMAPDIFLEHVGLVADDTDDRVITAINRYRSSTGRATKDLLTTEKVKMLKTVSIFARTADHVLAAIAPLLEHNRLTANETLFEKGDLGNSMYIIYKGNVCVHDGNETIRELSDSDIFGEMTALDPMPRSASVTATSETHLYRLDQETLLELMAERTEILQGVVQVLCHRLRV